MIILDEKMPLPPPPPYFSDEPTSPPPFPQPTEREPLTLATLPPHLLLRIVYETFSQTSSIERQRKTLYWLNTSLRQVCRSIYVACMHVLRSTYLPAYSPQIRSPYSSDPFPLTTPASATYPSPDTSLSPVLSLQRETRVLDLFIALKVREDVWLDESELHLEREESFRDLFDLMQPRSRLEDLVRIYGVREGVVSIPGSSPTILKRPKLPSIPFSALSVSFSVRKVGLVLTTRERKKTIIEVERRSRNERLEVAAKQIVEDLKLWLLTTQVQR
ncbi:hypothetical protein K474DRAFT_1646885 [Panus rudis PR-1116 ss-1]|nr:hypothetical protein K474DRAFT_1646885 [Panus rudis PR-1116 ss-1]